MWFFIPIPRVRTRRRYYRSCSSSRQRTGPLAGMPDRLIYPTLVPIGLGWVAMLAAAPRGINSGPWHAVLTALSFVLIFGGAIWMVAIIVRWKLSQKHSSPPPRATPPAQEPPEPAPLPLGPRPRPVNREAPIDRPYPFRPY
jgi:hypothetical protein